MRSESVLKTICGITAGVLCFLIADPLTRARSQPPQWKEAQPAIRVQVDKGRNRVWVLGLNGVYIYDKPTGKLVRHVELPNWMAVRRTIACAPDLVLAPTGAALVTSNIQPIIWEIDEVNMAVRQHKLAIATDTDKDFGFTALTFDREGRELLGLSSFLGAVWRIDLATNKAQKLQSPKPVRGDCDLGLQKNGL